MEICWACAEANGKDALQVGQVYIPIFSKSTQSRCLKRTAVFTARSYLIHTETVQNIERPILYLSKTLDKHERNYWATELEVGALVWALSKLKQYMDAGELTIVTDHSVIKSVATALKKGKCSNHLNNWALFLSRYAGHMTIRHREGRPHW